MTLPDPLIQDHPHLLALDLICKVPLPRKVSYPQVPGKAPHPP